MFMICIKFKKGVSLIIPSKSNIYPERYLLRDLVGQTINIIVKLHTIGRITKVKSKFQ
ncbi:hypothetical protein M472_09330 [Sphingobacterium paucimobilis HER1398]|uniref:Uncharacterized protein n=1 Tax=Sphingobacterium paucimobilis HER1398 TaxID=1346330 RepID=U2J8H7_9SPHI|nr:hypothetical protein M472_09330 [Sphingobacterium paucimobilis HER1398]